MSLPNDLNMVPSGLLIVIVAVEAVPVKSPIDSVELTLSQHLLKLNAK